MYGDWRRRRHNLLSFSIEYSEGANIAHIQIGDTFVIQLSIHLSIMKPAFHAGFTMGITQ